MNRNLSDICANIKILKTLGSPDILVNGLAYDSREVKEGFVFFALEGLHVDGHSYIEKAIEKGAKAVIHSKELETYQKDITYIKVPNTRETMSPVAASFYDYPSKKLCVIGVTGTEGKSTTVYLIYQLLLLMGKKAGFISTVQYSLGLGEEWNPEHQTTPEATTIHKHLATMVENGVEFAVVESSSHGLSPKTNRLGDVKFDAGIMMNVTHEHMEFHGTWEQYRTDKANLFRALDHSISGLEAEKPSTTSHAKAISSNIKTYPSFGIVNADDPSADFFTRSTKKSVFSYSSKGNDATFKALDIKSDADGSSFCIQESASTYEARIELPGAFNVDNSLAALICVSQLLSLPASNLIPHLKKLKPVCGRMTAIKKGQDFEVIVDYAHTPSSFLAIFPSLRKRIDTKIISLFGSAGERDTKKRAEQGKIASDYSDIVILTDEDPRGEDPMELIEMIAEGCTGKRDESLFLIPDRKKAIRKALSLAKKGDLVLLLGKGHENSIIYAKGTIPWNEIKEAETALEEMGYK